LCKKKQAEDLRTELEKEADIHYFTMSDGAQVRVLEFNAEEKSDDKIFFVIPGFITVFQSWHRVIELLSKKYHIYYFESREKISSKLTRKQRRQITLRRMALDIKEVIEQLDLDKKPYYTLCSSTGGTIEIEALSEKWIQPKAAVMIGPTIEYNIRPLIPIMLSIIPNFMKTLFHPLIKWYLGKFYVNKEEEPEQFNKYYRAAKEAHVGKVRGVIWEMRKYECWDMVPEIDTTILLLGASKDIMHRTEMCTKVHKMLPNSTYVDLGSNKATHSDPLIDEIEKFIQEL
jgi:pimeloyl-ACP methyl ester carboxylesterase